ncbi:hypothetical protein SPRG_22329 [Saprolegnia parasitica CBS 223.65]|uniref:2'-5' RNA ligase family protein n=1 Tax=Saprolegnia parasitica (strain CBS 223.65) TaxID=695850 RepID=A0A067C1A0_SAPPC|nr:hypothetical protein SPRG_22329 [Saprolegnia parasitica CBS 223.65]KDO20582.1 hypothetical protein SPRG_22329 [Saprolegnia parasitica CBS 223.65]|eukprot:XP_012208711.1 hypothetical protein SPRG_22329 [Saprolegnia parasitica CBS 223.65]
MKNALPSHLSHQAALAVILHESSPHYDGVQRVRAAHDKAFQRWPPHINLLYPFLSAPSEQLPMIVERAKLQAAFPECDHDKRAFAPHLTLGQAEGGVQATAALRSAMEAQLLPLPPWAIASVVVLERNGRDDPFRVVHQVPLRG